MPRSDRSAQTDIRQRQAFQRLRFNIVAGGTATLASGVASVTSRETPTEGGIVLTRQDGANPGYIYVSARTFGLGFTIRSSNILDNGDVFWLIVK